MNRPPLNTGIDLDNPVTCKTCGSSYMCTPWSDYYGATCNTDGQCERCLLHAAGLGGARVVTVVTEPKERPEPMGDPVRVVRSSGTVENDWEVAADHGDRVTVRKWMPLLGEYLIKSPHKVLFNHWQEGGTARSGEEMAGMCRVPKQTIDRWNEEES